MVGQFLQEHLQTVGFIAAILTTSSFAPQLIRTWKHGADDLSWAMLTLFGSGVGLWLVYGIVLQSPPVIAANALTGVQILAIALIKMRPAFLQNLVPSVSARLVEDRSPAN